MDKRREAWLIQQEREREHEVRKQKMILDYELKRAAILGSKGSSEKLSNQNHKESRSKSRGFESLNCNRPRRVSKPSVMSRKFESAGGNTSLFAGPEELKFNTTELRSIKVDIHRNIPGEMATYCEIQRGIVNLEEVKLKRREDEGAKPLFDREELKLRERTTNNEVEERRTVKTIDSESLGKTNHSLRKLSRSVSSLRRHGQSTSKDSSGASRHEAPVHGVENNHHRNWSNERGRSRGHGRRNRSNDPITRSSLHLSDTKNSSESKSSRDRSYYAERKRSPQQNRSPQSDRDDEERYRESQGRSRENRKRERSVESRGKDRSRDGRMPTLPHYVEQVPVPVYYGVRHASIIPLNVEEMVSMSGNTREFDLFMKDQIRKFGNKGSVDSTPDVSHVDQLTFVIRYVTDDGTLVECFLLFVKNSRYKRYELADAVVSTLEAFGLKVIDCSGQSYDNATNCSSMYKGLQTRNREINGLAIYAPCGTYALNSRFFMSLRNLYSKMQVLNCAAFHAADDVIAMECNFSRISTFPFENFLGKLTSLIRTPNRPLSQICRRVHELSLTDPPKPKLPHKITVLTLGINSIVFNENHFKYPLLNCMNKFSIELEERCAKYQVIYENFAIITQFDKLESSEFRAKSKLLREIYHSDIESSLDDDQCYFDRPLREHQTPKELAADSDIGTKSVSRIMNEIAVLPIKDTVLNFRLPGLSGTFRYFPVQTGDARSRYGSHKQEEAPQLQFKMFRSCLSSTNNYKESKQSSSSKDHHRRNSTRSKEEISRRREEWLILQERKREHERRKQKMILEYELKRAAMLGSKEDSGRSSHRSRRERKSKSPDHRSRDHKGQSRRQPFISQKFQSNDGDTHLLKGPRTIKFDLTELRRIRVDIHRNIPGIRATNCELQRDIVNPEEIKLKRRADEGVKLIFDREELKHLKNVTSIGEVEDHQTVRTDSERSGEKIHSSRRCSRSLSPPRIRNNSAQKVLFSHRYRKRNRSTDPEKRFRSNKPGEDNSLYRSDRKNNSLKRRFSRERSYSIERRRYPPAQYRSSRSTWDKKYCRGKSKDRRERQRSSRNREREKSKDMMMPSLSHYIAQVPVPVYYGNFPPRPVISGLMMSIRGPWPQHLRFPVRPRAPFSPQFIHPDFYQPGFPYPAIQELRGAAGSAVVTQASSQP
ncbi:uncharacterized protein LOC117180475 [Belonocnema kinseyi]|uniref:uncharacterized protein LOC117180475 n=1 Tax=Belonocnema kinseyi TaxID=2817044 RepID=UPI00143DDD35|nr:uncharacterized protein LOC117180475 [Belonocnema kinseyi]